LTRIDEQAVRRYKGTSRTALHFGADEMVALAKYHGKAVYFSLAEIPTAS